MVRATKGEDSLMDKIFVDGQIQWWAWQGWVLVLFPLGGWLLGVVVAGALNTEDKENAQMSGCGAGIAGFFLAMIPALVLISKPDIFGWAFLGILLVVVLGIAGAFVSGKVYERWGE